MSDIDAILADIDFLAANWADLVNERQPGTQRPWRQGLLDPDRRAAMAARDREERDTRDPDAPGFTSAPSHVGVLDTIVDAWVALDELVALLSPDWRRTRSGGAVGRAGSEFGPAPVTDIDGMVEFIRTWLPDVGPDLDPAKLHRVARRITATVADATRLLGLIRAGQLLNGACCPWCRGVTPKHPAGGAVTMRVEMIPGSDRLGTDEAAAVVCWNPLCTPPESDCGAWFRGRPAWPWHEWEWLADRLIIADPVNVIARPATFWDDPAVFAVQHSGRSGVDAAVAVVPPRATGPAPVRELPGQSVTFVGGPFRGQTRRFVHTEQVLCVTRPGARRRYQLAGPNPADPVHGIYTFAIVNGQPSYVWTVHAAAV